MHREQLAACIDALIDCYARNRQTHVRRIVVDAPLPLLRKLCACDPDGSLHYRGFAIEPTAHQIQRDAEQAQTRAERTEQHDERGHQ